MSIGSWRLRPEGAAGGLDAVPPDQWPRLAGRWLAAGFDSEPLRRLAALGSGETRAALVLMPEALRSIGFDPAAADGEFVARCQAALDIVQRDLEVTGYGRYRVRAHLGWGWPTAVFAALPDGSYWSGGWGMTREMGGVWLLFNAAGSVSDTLKEVHEVEWPVCAVHGGHSGASIWDGGDPVVLIGEVVWWWCTRAGHALAPVGQLTVKAAGA